MFLIKVFSRFFLELVFFFFIVVNYYFQVSFNLKVPESSARAFGVVECFEG